LIISSGVLKECFLARPSKIRLCCGVFVLHVRYLNAPLDYNPRTNRGLLHQQTLTMASRWSSVGNARCAMRPRNIHFGGRVARLSTNKL
jgi:hypothetical protein